MEPSNSGQAQVRRYLIATVGSRTERGGEVISGQQGLFIGQEGTYIEDRLIACVGDVVRYPDGSESIIASGAGYADMIDNRPVALVGSHIANGDRIISSPQSAVELAIPEDAEPIPGFLQPGFIPTRTSGYA